MPTGAHPHSAVRGLIHFLTSALCMLPPSCAGCYEGGGLAPFGSAGRSNKHRVNCALLITKASPASLSRAAGETEINELVFRGQR